MILLQTVHTLVVLGHGLLFKPVELNRDELNRLRQILATVLKLALHLTAASQVVANDGFVVGIEGVRVLGFNHDFVSFKKSLHASLPLSFVLRVQFFDRLFVQAG